MADVLPQKRIARAESVRRNLPTIDAAEFKRATENKVQVVSPSANDSSPLMRGEFSIRRLRDGMHLHCTDIVHLQPLTTRTLMQGNCVKVLLKLEGDARVRLGRQVLPMDSGCGQRACPKGAVVCLGGPEEFERCCKAGCRQRMVVVTLAPEWFASARMIEPLASDQLTVRTWVPTPRAIAIAEQLLHPAAFEGPLHDLYLESRVLELVAEALARTQEKSLPKSQALPPGLRPGEYARACRLRDLLESGRADSMSMDEMAQAMRCNASTLQQQFRQIFGKTIFDYLRNARLQRAAQALQHDGVSVARAAEIAGYGSQANFSTAFRRYFGAPPKIYRARF